MERGLYIHIPFCKSKCLYCDFCSYSGSENLMMDYSRSLAEEISNIGECRIKTIFIGGGTPTYLSLEAWEPVAKSISRINKAENLEFTIEGNPGTFTRQKLEYFRSMGINRLSIGLQAAQNRLLKALGRIHSIEEFVEGYNMARSLGFDNINIDIMFALPDQTLKDWQETLEFVTGLQPEHISAYSLIIEEGTEFYKKYNEGKLELPDEDLERQMYSLALEQLKEKGYNHYEISNFAKPGKECRHNLIYWDLDEYIGCGAGAHSYKDGKRYSNSSSIEGYISKNQREIHINTLKDDMEEFMFMGLRKIQGISIKKFNKKFKTDIFKVYGDVIARHSQNGLLILKDDMLRLSSRGIEVSNFVMCDFIL